MRRSAVVVLMLALLIACRVWADDVSRPKQPAFEQRTALSERFEKEIWPVLTRDREGKSCVGCHNEENPSSLKFLPDTASNFTMLLDKGFFDPDEPSSLLARVTAPDAEVRMPPKEAPPLDEKDTSLLRAFTGDIFKAIGKNQARAELLHQFPRELLGPWEAESVESSPPATFLSFWQLKAKVRAIFADDWYRNNKDMFAENVQLFGGADFVIRYNENSKPRADFLSALEQLARDVTSKAYLQSTGPFTDRPQEFVSPHDLKEPDDIYSRQISQLYQRILLRKPSHDEIQNAFQLLADIDNDRESLSRRSYVLTFELEVRDPVAKITTTKGVSVRVQTNGRGLFQQYLDQSIDAAEPKVELQLPGTFQFKTDDDAQTLRVSNRDTDGNVSIAGIQLTGPLPERTEHLFGVTDPGVQAAGIWSHNDGDEFVSLENSNRAKGNSSVLIPIRVQQDGAYEVAVSWRKSSNNSRSVPIEIVSHSRTQLALPPDPPPPASPPGQSIFTIDQTDDTIAFWETSVRFRFSSELDFVEVTNAGTVELVTADAVKFVPDTGPSFLIDNDQAIGRDKWQTSTVPTYNRVGSDALTDGNQKNEVLRLAYKPSIMKEWHPDFFYRVFFSYPARASHEPQTPLIIRATASSPFVRLRSPPTATVGSNVEMDASHTYNIQRSALEFTWRQVGGPQVTFNDPNQAKVSFTAPNPAESSIQTGWVSLAHALMMHPDFLFTRAPSIDTVSDPLDKHRLQLNKIALDLLGRPPVVEELGQLDAGKSLEAFIDAYLRTDEFEKFYFHRVRLLLESHGTEVQDEPVRMWCYVALHDRPFQEILTADYTVDTAMTKQPRPAEHGRSGILTTPGFIEGKPGLPHFNYAAQVAEKFLGYVFVVPPEIEQQREMMTALSTTSPTTTCYRCHKLLTPLAHQRLAWSDDGEFRTEDEDGKPIDDSDRCFVASYPFAGKGMEAFATKAIKTEPFIRTMIDSHFIFYFGRQMRYRGDERFLYKELWDAAHQDGFTIRGLIKAILMSPEYLQRRRSDTTYATFENGT